MLKIFKRNKSEIKNRESKIPAHIAFICDGNRRWAKERGLPPLAGHTAGISRFEKLVDWFIKHGVSTITFYIFSTENWDRSKDEVDFLMNLFYTELKKNLKHAMSKNLRYRVIGSRDRLPKKLAALCDKLENNTAENTGGTVVFALNYGGQGEIIAAVNNIVEHYKNNPTDDRRLTTDDFESYLDTGDLLPVDMMVRTSNEHRISNYLLWKLAYAELMFMPQHWPELVKSEKLWQSVLDEFSKRTRRFGGGVEKDYSGKKGKTK